MSNNTINITLYLIWSDIDHQMESLFFFVEWYQERLNIYKNYTQMDICEVLGRIIQEFKIDTPIKIYMNGPKNKEYIIQEFQFNLKLMTIKIVFGVERNKTNLFDEFVQ